MSTSDYAVHVLMLLQVSAVEVKRPALLLQACKASGQQQWCSLTVSPPPALPLKRAGPGARVPPQGCRRRLLLEVRRRLL